MAISAACRNSTPGSEDAGTSSAEATGRGRDMRHSQKSLRRMLSVAALLSGGGRVGRGRRGIMAAGIGGRGYLRCRQRREADGAGNLQQQRRHRRKRGNSSGESKDRHKSHLQLPQQACNLILPHRSGFLPRLLHVAGWRVLSSDSAKRILLALAGGHPCVARKTFAGKSSARKSTHFRRPLLHDHFCSGPGCRSGSAAGQLCPGAADAHAAGRSGARAQ